MNKYGSFEDLAHTCANIAKKAGPNVWNMPKRIRDNTPDVHLQLACSMSAWASAGLPRVVLSHTLAAAFLSTQPGSLDKTVIDPWPTWSIYIPNGLLGPLTHILIHRKDDHPNTEGCTHSLIACNWDQGDDALIFIRDGVGLIDVATFEEENGYYTLEETRYVQMAARLAIGCARELETPRPNPFAKPLRRKVSRSIEGQLVETNSGYRLTRDVKVDCRAYVKDYLAGNISKVPTVRWLTRGHWRHQACGPKFSERKWIHIEPYWNNADKSLPIAVRSHVL